MVSYWEPRGLHGRGGSHSLTGRAAWCSTVMHGRLLTPRRVLAPWPRRVSVCLRFQRVSRKAAWRQRGAAGPRAGAWLAVRGFGSARICVGSCPLPRAPSSSNERGLCLRSPYPPHFTLFNRVWMLFFLLLPNIHVRVCVEYVFEEEGKKNKTTHSEGYILARAQEMKTPGQRRRQRPPSWAG